MKKNISLLLIIVFAWAFTSCRKFLDIVPSTQTVNPIKMGDFMEMLNSDSFAIGNYFPLDLMSDDVYMSDNIRTKLDNFYTRSYQWKETIWNPADVDFMYNDTYARVLQMNIVLSRIDAAPADSLNTVANRSNVLSQALFHRSWCYLQLVNTYGAGYNAATAATDPGVPLVLSPSVSALPARASVGQVYSQVVSDLRKAANNPYLPAKGADIIHPGKAAVYALLSRTYLYMANYDSAYAYADSSLQLASTLRNYVANYYSSPSQLADMASNVEILMGKVCYEQNFYAIMGYSIELNPSLKALFNSYDTRYSNKFNYLNALYTTSYNSVTTILLDFSISVPEMMLTKAECLARKGSYGSAIDLVNALAATRVRYYTPITSYDASTTLTQVLAERRRELYYRCGMRLFDLKRLNQQPATAVNLQRLAADNSVIATLPAFSNRYVMPFSQLVLAANPNITQNAR